MKTIRRVVSLAFAAALAGSCTERKGQKQPTTATGAASAQGAVGKTSVVRDPIGDATKAARRYQDVVSAEIMKHGRHFVFVMELATPVPHKPPVPSGADVIVWMFSLDTDTTEFQVGYPHPGTERFEFQVQLRQYRDGFTDPLDPTRSAGVLVDRRPLLTGRQAILTAIEYSIEGTKITWVVDAASLGDPSAFQWISGTCSAHARDDVAKIRYDQIKCFDVVPEFSAPLAVWPQ